MDLEGILLAQSAREAARAAQQKRQEEEKERWFSDRVEIIEGDDTVEASYPPPPSFSVIAIAKYSKTVTGDRDLTPAMIESALYSLLLEALGRDGDIMPEIFTKHGFQNEEELRDEIRTGLETEDQRFTCARNLAREAADELHTELYRLGIPCEVVSSSPVSKSSYPLRQKEAGRAAATATSPAQPEAQPAAAAKASATSSSSTASSSSSATANLAQDNRKEAAPAPAPTQTQAPTPVVAVDDQALLESEPWRKNLGDNPEILVGYPMLQERWKLMRASVSVKKLHPFLQSLIPLHLHGIAVKVGGERGVLLQGIPEHIEKLINRLLDPWMSWPPNSTLSLTRQQDEHRGFFVIDWDSIYSQVQFLPPHLYPCLRPMMIQLTFALEQGGLPFDSARHEAIQRTGNLVTNLLNHINDVTRIVLASPSTDEAAIAAAALNSELAGAFDEEIYNSMSVKDLKTRMVALGLSTTGFTEKSEMVDAIRNKMFENNRVVIVVMDAPLAWRGVEDLAIGEPRRATEVERWFTQIGSAITGALGDEDPVFHPEAYAWHERGWVDRKHFETHVIQQLVKSDRCVIARRQTVREAMQIISRLSLRDPSGQAIGFVAAHGPSGIPNLRPISEAPSEEFGDRAWQEVMTGQRAGRHGGLMNDLPQGLRDLFEQLGNSGGQSSGGKTKETGTPKGVRDSLPVLTLEPVAGSETLRVKGMAEAETQCCICTCDYKEGEEVTSLPCGHCFHRGSEQNATDDTCQGIIGWLQKHQRCPVCRLSITPEGLQHTFVDGRCRVCVKCAKCTGFGAVCMKHLGRDRSADKGKDCGCGRGKAGCEKCGVCEKCADEHLCTNGEEDTTSSSSSSSSAPRSDANAPQGGGAVASSSSAAASEASSSASAVPAGSTSPVPLSSSAQSPLPRKNSLSTSPRPPQASTSSVPVSSSAQSPLPKSFKAEKSFVDTLREGTSGGNKQTRMPNLSAFFTSGSGPEGLENFLRSLPSSMDKAMLREAFTTAVETVVASATPDTAKICGTSAEKAIAIFDKVFAPGGGGDGAISDVVHPMPIPIIGPTKSNGEPTSSLSPSSPPSFEAAPPSVSASSSSSSTKSEPEPVVESSSTVAAASVPEVDKKQAEAVLEPEQKLSAPQPVASSVAASVVEVPLDAPLRVPKSESEMSDLSIFFSSGSSSSEGLEAFLRSLPSSTDKTTLRDTFAAAITAVVSSASPDTAHICGVSAQEAMTIFDKVFPSPPPASSASSSVSSSSPPSSVEPAVASSAAATVTAASVQEVEKKQVVESTAIEPSDVAPPFISRTDSSISNVSSTSAYSMSSAQTASSKSKGSNIRADFLQLGQADPTFLCCPGCDGPLPDTVKGRCTTCSICSIQVIHAANRSIGKPVYEFAEAILDEIARSVENATLSQYDCALNVEDRLNAFAGNVDVNALEGSCWIVRESLMAMLRHANDRAMSIKSKAEQGTALLTPPSPVVIEFEVDTASRGMARLFSKKMAARAPHLLAPAVSIVDGSANTIPVRGIVKNFIARETILRDIAKMLAKGSSETAWAAVQLNIRRWESNKWRLQEAIELMRAGMRDLQTLTSDLDTNSGAIVQHILTEVFKFEAEGAKDSLGFPVASNSGKQAISPSSSASSASATDLDDDLLPPDVAPTLKRQKSTGGLTIEHLSDLKDAVPDAAQRQSLLANLKGFLIDLKKNPTNNALRFIAAGDPLLAQVSIKGMLLAAGFESGTKGDGSLVLGTYDPDRVARVLHILKEEEDSR